MDNLNQLITSYNYSNIHNPSYSSWDVQIMSSSSNNNNSNNINMENNNIIITSTPTKNPYPDHLFFPNHHIGQEIITLLEQDEKEEQEDRKVVLLDGQDRLDHHNHDRDGDRDRDDDDDDDQDLGAMKEMMYKMAAMQPVDIDPATIRRPKRRNVRISEDPQSVAARHRRERISERIRVLQRLVPGGTKMDTASMLDEAIRYVKFLKRQIRILQQQSNNTSNNNNSSNNYLFPQLVGSGVINSSINNNNNNNNNNSYQRLILGTNYSSSESTWPGFSPAPNR